MNPTLTSDRNRPRSAALWGPAAAVLALFLIGLWFGVLQENRRGSPVTNPPDFRAYYCGAVVAAAGGDPYRAEPLGACESAAAGAFGYVLFPHLVMPAPLPGYALAFFAPFAALPFPTASAIWFGILVAALATTVFLVVDLTRRPMLTVLL
ncbi:MAG: hypothetical protein ACREM8_12635, partial [Vulcanimicrobiaceae bacterium]